MKKNTVTSSALEIYVKVWLVVCSFQLTHSLAIFGPTAKKLEVMARRGNLYIKRITLMTCTPIRDHFIISFLSDNQCSPAVSFLL